LDGFCFIAHMTRLRYGCVPSLALSRDKRR